MNLHVKSAMHQTLVFSIPRKNIDPLDIITFIFRNFGAVDGFHHFTNPSGSKLEISFAKIETYQAVLQQGFVYQGCRFEPVVPTPPSFKTWKINY
ncbi:hypothetical protein BGX26_001785, partial [Mortierella sp. AD094]